MGWQWKAHSAAAPVSRQTSGLHDDGRVWRAQLRIDCNGGLNGDGDGGEGRGGLARLAHSPHWPQQRRHVSEYSMG